MECCLHPGGLHLTEQLLQMAALPKGASILDLGCGGGQSVSLLRQQGYQAWGIDRTADGTNPLVQAGDITRLPAGAETLDCLLAECSLSASEAPASVLREAYRVLKPGGHLLLSDVFFRETDGEQGELWTDLVRNAGFALCSFEDVSQHAQSFFLTMIWEQGCLPEDWKRIAAGRRKVGYFLLHAKKNVE